ncbi:hypothetical protein [Tengunoibacter tsumagoiensis]|uniref:Uncharacterized protein n=1 Tax=Tengunoibacter tsumagoiensis TaxID=2014871 RepID=A0A402A4A8_9CHLR|nr:hypothetical protein [Tengunoibacter tsumagoiensis]GCE13886.1 hypothetical protein KTT_37450 [Tengunoibacter tsumagoiensis]
MNLTILHRFHPAVLYCYAMCLVEEEGPILGMLFTLQGVTHLDATAVLVLFNLTAQAIEHTIVYKNAGPDQAKMLDGLLYYDSFHKRWVIVQSIDEEYIAMRTFSPETGLSPLCLIDRDEAVETGGMESALALQIWPDYYTFLYPKPFDVHLRAPEITKRDIVIQQAKWLAMRDELAIITKNDDHLGQIPLWTSPQTVWLPDNAEFDPGTPNAHLTSAVHIQQSTTLAESELSLIYSDAKVHLLVLFSSESWPRTQMELPKGTPHEGTQWRAWLTGWDRDWQQLLWVYAPDLGIETDAKPSYLFWPDSQVALVAGPPHAETATVVLAMAFQKNGKGVSHAACLDEHGQPVQIAADAIGERPELCCAGSMVVGVDLLDGTWRLWNWKVLESTHFAHHQPLSGACKRAHVFAEPASERFWLVEEELEGVRISHREVSTLHEVSEEVFVAGVRVREDGEELPMFGYRRLNIMPYQSSLLFLARDASDVMALYKVE